MVCTRTTRWSIPSASHPHSYQIDMWICNCSNLMVYSTTPPLGDFSRLVRRQLSNHGHVVHCCRRCLHAYSSQELLDAHALDCCHAQRTTFPKDPRCRFTNIWKQLVAPFVVYSDFESILQRVDDDEAMDTTYGVAAGGGGDEPIAASGPPMQLCIQGGE